MSVSSRRYSLSVVAIAALSAFAAACSDSTTGATADDAGIALGLQPGQLASLESVDTQLSASNVSAGTAVTVLCIGQPGEVKIPQPTYNVNPKTGVTTDKANLTATLSGAYQVQCTLPGHDLNPKDKSATLHVTAGPAATLTTTINPQTIHAGDIASAACSGKDQYGNDVGKDGTVWTLTIDPPNSGTIADLTVTGLLAGTQTVKCGLDSSPDAASPGATLTITAGPAFKTTATVTPPTFEAGNGSAQVTCAATDSYGNTVDASGATLMYSKDLTSGSGGLTTTKAGKYDILCMMADVTKENATPGTLTVTPGAPISMTLAPKPKKAFYMVDDTIKMFGLGKDKYGNDVPDMPLQQPCAVDPPEGVTVNAGGKSYSFNTDGHYKFSGTSLDFPSLSAEITLTCDSVGPLVLITDPVRGWTWNGDPLVKVKGTCIDATSAVKSLTISGVAVPVNGDGSFEYDMTSVWGLNAIIWASSDEWGNATDGVQTYYYSTKWYATDFDKPKESEINDGIGIWLSQKILDNGTHNHAHPNDIATVIEVVLGSLDLNTLLGGGAVIAPIKLALGPITLNVTPSVKNLKLGDPAQNGGFPLVDLNVLKDGIQMKAKIYKFSADLDLDIQIPPLPGLKTVTTIAADEIDLSLDILLSKDPTTGKLISQAKNTKITFQNLTVLPNGPLANFLNGIGIPLNTFLAQIESAILAPLTNLLTGALGPQLDSLIGGALGNALGALAINTTIPLGPFIGKGDPVLLKLTTDIGSIGFQEAQGLIFGLSASMTAEKKVAHTTLGSIGRAGCLADKAKPEVFNPTEKYGLELGAADDFLNQLFYSLWNGGGLQLTIDSSVIGSATAQFGITDMSIETDFWLPPIVNECLPATPGKKPGEMMLHFQIGDIGLHAKLNFSGTPIDMHAFVTVQADLGLLVGPLPNDPTNTAISVSSVNIAPENIHMEIVSINQEAAALGGTFKSLITGIVPGMLPGLLGNTLSQIQLPSIDLSTLSPQIPKGTLLTFSLQEMLNAAGYTYIGGTLK
jgi:hypothetical protein